jgi:uncharacterized protein DUF4394
MPKTQAAALSLALLFSLGCDERDSPISPSADPGPSRPESEIRAAETADAEVTTGMSGLIFGVDADNTLIAFSRRNPGSLNRRVAITGTDGEIAGVDFRPNDLNPADGRNRAGKLYGLTKTAVYVINPMTGVATRMRTLTTPLAGAFFGTGFNPTVDRLRSHADGGRNNAVNADDGATAVNTPLAYAPGDVNGGKAADIVGTAYTNSVDPAPATTTLYAIDAATVTAGRPCVGFEDPAGAPPGCVLPETRNARDRRSFPAARLPAPRPAPAASRPSTMRATTRWEECLGRRPCIAA